MIQSKVYQSFFLNADLQAHLSHQKRLLEETHIFYEKFKIYIRESQIFLDTKLLKLKQHAHLQNRCKIFKNYVNQSDEFINRNYFLLIDHQQRIKSKIEKSLHYLEGEIITLTNKLAF